MFYYVSGTVGHVEPYLAVIDCGGVGYACRTTTYTLSTLKKGDKAKLFTYLNVREDAMELYGFGSQEELTLFQQLISVSGVGPKAALRILSSSTPANLALAQLEHHSYRQAGFSDLDVNGHVNNTKYLDWIDDLLPSAFHQAHPVREISICYLSEILEGQHLDLTWELQDGPCIRVDAHRNQDESDTKKERAFSARVLFA